MPGEGLRLIGKTFAQWARNRGRPESDPACISEHLDFQAARADCPGFAERRDICAHHDALFDRTANVTEMFSKNEGRIGGSPVSGTSSRWPATRRAASPGRLRSLVGIDFERRPECRWGGVIRAVTD